MNTLIILGAIGLLVIILVAIYNGLVTARMRVNEAWSDITVQLKRRYDLIPNLVDTVKGYAKHERGVFEQVTKTRAEALDARTIEETEKTDNQFKEALKSLFAVAENYPDLKADQNYRELQQELVDTEDKIQAARRFYNGSVRDLNTKIQTFPTNVVAALFKFKEREFFEVDQDEAAAVNEPVKVSFDESKTEQPKSKKA